MKRLNFSNNEYYHIFNRGVEKRDIFLDKSDYFRFLICLREFNGAGKKAYHLAREGDEMVKIWSRPEVALVNIVCYCLMPNHFHLLVRQSADNGISKFMQRIGVGYTNYFNLRYERSGVLFQGAFKARHVETESYLLQLSRYIHLNPSDSMEDKAVKHPWSSLQFYMNSDKRCLIRLHKEIIMGYFDGWKKYRDFLFFERSLLDDYLKID